MSDSLPSDESSLKFSSSHPPFLLILARQPVFLFSSCSSPSTIINDLRTNMSQHTETNPHFSTPPQQYAPPQSRGPQVEPQRGDRQVRPPSHEVPPQFPDRHAQPPHREKRVRFQPQQEQQEVHFQPRGPDQRGQPRREGTLPVRSQKTKPIAWFIAAFCAIFWVIIILGGLIVLIVYLVYRPRSPKFEVSGVTLNAAYLDMGSLLNADVTLLANFTNPNKKVKVDFHSVVLDLYYASTRIATTYVDSFSTASAESKFQTAHMITSQVRLPLRESQRLVQQMEANRVVFVIKGYFRTRSNLGFLRYSYWLYGHCSVIVTAPPSGVLVRKKCKTKR